LDDIMVMMTGLYQTYIVRWIFHSSSNSKTVDMLLYLCTLSTHQLLLMLKQLFWLCTNIQDTTLRPQLTDNIYQSRQRISNDSLIW